MTDLLSCLAQSPDVEGFVLGGSIPDVGFTKGIDIRPGVGNDRTTLKVHQG